MVSLVLVIGVLNLGLGFALAVALHQSGYRGLATEFEVEKGPPHPRGSHAAPDDVAATTCAGSESSRVVPIPLDWENVLESAELEPSCASEAAVWVLGFELRPYREHLIGCEHRLRDVDEPLDVESSQAMLDELAQVNASWVGQLSAAAKILDARDSLFAGEEELDEPLADIMLDQIAQIEASKKALASIRLQSDLQTGGKRTTNEICTLIEGVDQVRDQLNGLLALVLRATERLCDLDERLRLDRLTETYNRVGLECVFDQWRQEERSHLQELSLVVIDIDRFAKLNATYGYENGDRVIQGVGRLLQDLLRKNRGFDRVARFGGQSFCLLLAETGAERATCAAERMRQVIEATSFGLAGGYIQLTVSCSVAEVDPDESIYSVFRRLREGIKEAKRAGRNRTFQDDLISQEVIEPLSYQVKARVIDLDAS